MVDSIQSFETKSEEANPYRALTEGELLERLDKSRKLVVQGAFRNADEISRDLRVKYGL